MLLDSIKKKKNFSVQGKIVINKALTIVRVGLANDTNLKYFRNHFLSFIKNLKYFLNYVIMSSKKKNMKSCNLI